MTADLYDADTGEILSVEDAERRASYICTDLDGAAEQFEHAMATMREAVANRDDRVLGYRSPGDYISDRFGGRLARLGVDMRRDVVRELTEMGMSTRAIAPVVGAGIGTVHRDREATRVPSGTPESQGEGNSASGVSDPAPPEAAPRDNRPKDYPEAPAPAPRPDVTGIDGKTYSRPSTPTLTDEQVAEREMDRGRESTTVRIAECVHYLRNDPDVFVEKFLPHEPRFVTDGMRLSRDRIDEAITFLTAVRKAVQR